MVEEKSYDFKKELLQVHKKDVRDYSRKPKNDEFEFFEGIRIVMPEVDNVVIMTAARDFIDYLYVSMGVGAMLSRIDDPSAPTVTLSLSQDLGEANGYMGYLIETDEKGCCRNDN